MATIQFGDKSQLVDLPTFLNLRAEDPSIAKKAICPECGHRVHPFNVAGAKGFRTVNLEVTRRPFANRRPVPGFHHLDNNAGKDCSLSFANDPRFQGIRHNNEFPAEVRERNLEALNRPGAREVVEQVQNFLMQKLTNTDRISTETRQALDKIQYKLLSMRGLNKNLWLLGYIPPVLMPPQVRASNSKSSRVEFLARGQQKINFIGEDGQERAMIAPTALVVCYKQKGRQVALSHAALHWRARIYV